MTKVSYPAKEEIMQNVTKLKDMINKHNQKIFINEQIPEGVNETRKQISDRLKGLRAENEKKPVNEQKNIQVMNDKIVVDGKIMEPDVKAPEPADLFLDADELRLVKALNTKLKETKPITVKNSQFVGLAIKVHSTQEVNRAYKAVALRYPSVDHIMVAYGFKDGMKVHSGNVDDGEHGGSNVIKQTLKSTKAKDIAVFVVRKYGGIRLGFDRFPTIEAVTKEALKMIKGG